MPTHRLEFMMLGLQREENPRTQGRERPNKLYSCYSESRNRTETPEVARGERQVQKVYLEYLITKNHQKQSEMTFNVNHKIISGTLQTA